MSNDSVSPTPNNSKTREVECNVCGGLGELDCRECSGTGRIINSWGDKADCRNCDGDGKRDCQNCKGTGTLTEEVPAEPASDNPLSHEVRVERTTETRFNVQRTRVTVYFTLPDGSETDIWINQVTDEYGALQPVIHWPMLQGADIASTRAFAAALDVAINEAAKLTAPPAPVEPAAILSDTTDWSAFPPSERIGAGLAQADSGYDWPWLPIAESGCVVWSNAPEYDAPEPAKAPEPKAAKLTARNSAVLRYVKKQYNAAIYKLCLDIANKEGEQAALDYLLTKYVRPPYHAAVRAAIGGRS